MDEDISIAWRARSKETSHLIAYRWAARASPTTYVVWPRLAGQTDRNQSCPVSADEVDGYLDSVEEPKRTTLACLRQTILEILPDAEQGISYGVPAFKIRGKTIAGFAAFKSHLSYLPHSGSVFARPNEELAGYARSSGALRFDVDTPLPKELVWKLIAVRLGQAFAE